jgi:hypothetical protein
MEEKKSPGMCPYCLVRLEQDEEDVYCPNTIDNDACFYDSELTEEMNRILFQGSV